MAGPGIDNVTIRGNLTRDPEFYPGSDGKKDFARFDVAVNSRIFNEQTQQFENGDPTFHQVVAFGRLAENVRQLSKGDTVLVNGELQFSSYEREDGTRIPTTRIAAEDVGPSLNRYADLQIGSQSVRQSQSVSQSDSPRFESRVEQGPGQEIPQEDARIVRREARPAEGVIRDVPQRLQATPQQLAAQQ